MTNKNKNRNLIIGGIVLSLSYYLYKNGGLSYLMPFESLSTFDKEIVRSLYYGRNYYNTISGLEYITKQQLNKFIGYLKIDLTPPLGDFRGALLVLTDGTEFDTTIFNEYH